MAKKAKKKAKKLAKKSSKAADARLVPCYGLFWRWNNVHTGGGRANKGKLLGQKGSKSAVVDFRDQR